MTVYEMVNREFADLPISTMRYTQDMPINVSNHWHAAVEINYVVSGEISNFVMNGQTFRIQAGDFIVVNPNVSHAIWEQVSRIESITIFLLPEFFAQNNITLTNRRFFRTPRHHTDTDQVALQKFLEALDRVFHLTKEDEINLISLKRYIFALADILLSEWSYPVPETLPNLVDVNQKVLDIMAYFDSRLTEAVVPNDAAKYFHISDSYLARCFREAVGITPNEYIQYQRMQLAEVYLADTSQSIVQISINAGFSSEKSLQRVFRKYNNMSPSEFRKLVQKSSRN